MANFKQVDTHVHIWDLKKMDYGNEFPPPNSAISRDFLANDYCSSVREGTSVGTGVLVQVLHTPEETDWLFEQSMIVEEMIGGVVGWVDLKAPKVSELLDKLREHPKFVGIRHLTHNEPDVDWLLHADVHRGLAVLEEKGIAFDLLLRPQHLKHVPTLAKKFPRLKMVIDHISKPLIKDGVMDPWKADIEAAAQFSNVYCKISGLVTEADMQNWKLSDLQPYVKHVLSVFGAKRCMFGSDWPVCLLAADSYTRVHDAYFDCVKACGCSDDDMQAIFRDTAITFYNLKV